MELIDTRREFVALARRLGVRPDWHEPDEREVAARVQGSHLDNAMGATGECGELRVIFSQDGEDIAAVNLANLCAWASVPADEVAERERAEEQMYGRERA
ncbi:hypothetical protein [Micromonospora sp. NPDC047730]|uniref:hypothetical protein n=1 Tax=Micromonospora sp. NPDC047730 TaxID=3364253 RepID=UPI003710BB3A